MNATDNLNKIKSWYNEAQRRPAKYDVFQADDDGTYYHVLRKGSTPLYSIKIIIWREAKVIYSFNSESPHGRKLFFLLKKHKKIGVLDTDMNSFVIEPNDSDTKEIALVVIKYYDEINVIIASSSTEEADSFITVTDILGEAIDDFVAMLTKDTSANNTNAEIEGRDNNGKNFGILPFGS